MRVAASLSGVMLRPASSIARSLLVAASWLLASAPALAQRPVDSVPVLGSSELSMQLASRHDVVSSCAARLDTRAYLTEVRARVAPGRAPSTLFNARIRLTVRSRPRDPELERCVSGHLQQMLRQQVHAVTRTVRARHTFRVGAPPLQPPPRSRPPYSASQVERALDQLRGPLQRCLEQRGLADTVALSIAVDRAGRITLSNAQLPPGAPPRALGCMAATVSRAQLRSEPPRRRVTLRHTLRLR